jgi:hypothetical protein
MPRSLKLFAKQREIGAHDRFGVRKQRPSGAGLNFDDAAHSSREGTPGSSGKVHKKHGESCIRKFPKD